jgi:hypothetical protein
MLEIIGQGPLRWHRRAASSGLRPSSCLTLLPIPSLLALVGSEWPLSFGYVVASALSLEGERVRPGGRPLALEQA